MTKVDFQVVKDISGGTVVSKQTDSTSGGCCGCLAFLVLLFIAAILFGVGFTIGKGLL